MASMQDSSVLFSLKQLQALEETRLREEQEARRAREEAEQKAREEAERRAAEVAAERARLEAEQKAREEAERRAEAARMEAIRLAAVERARAEAEVKARLEAMRIAQEHEKALASLKEDAQKRRLKKSVLYGAVGSVALFAAASGLYFGKIKPDNEARLKQQQADIAAADEETARLKQKLAQQDARIKEAERSLGDFKNAPKPVVTPEPAPKPAAGPGPARKVEDKKNVPCTCQEGDPLCGCIR